MLYNMKVRCDSPPKFQVGVSISGGTPSHHPFLAGSFHEINHPFWGTPIYGHLQMVGLEWKNPMKKIRKNDDFWDTPMTMETHKTIY